jgi:hypothetical protein
MKIPAPPVLAMDKTLIDMDKTLMIQGPGGGGGLFD